VPADILTAESPPGRGIVDDREVQVALLGDRIDTPSQAAAMKAFGRSMVKAGIGEAQAIRRLPDRVLLADLPATLDGQPVLGLESESLDPLAFPPVGSFIVTGPPASGRSTTVLAMLAALRRQDPTWRVVLFTARKNGLATSGFAWTASAIGVDPVTELAEKLTSDLTAAAERSTALGRVAVVLENPAELAQGAMEDPLTALVGLALGNDLFVISEGEETTLNSSYGLLGALKATRYGLSLQPDGSTDSVYRTEFPMRLQRASFPEGRGLFVRRGRTSTVQVALPYGTE
jgi:S-DNA-T family DNA segregation ATPase FtsK/SpoIIIE